MMGGYERRGVEALNRIADALERVVAILTTEEDKMVYNGPDKTMVTTPAQQFYEPPAEDDDAVEPLVDDEGDPSE